VSFQLHNIRRRQLLIALGAGVAASPFAVLGQKSWPSQPIRLVVPFPPGGLLDTMARVLAPRITEELNQPVIVDNKPGAGGNIGAAEVARAKPDGYTLLMASPALTISPALYTKLAYKPEQLAPVGLIGRVPNVLLVSPKSGIKTVAELIAKAKSAPGKLNYGSNGNGTSLHLCAELFKGATNTSITHVPYRGSAQALTALLAGEVDMMFENLPNVVGQINAGTVTALAVTTRRRSKILPSVPTLKESNLPDFDVSAWYGLVAPTGLPLPILARLEKVVDKLSRDVDMVRNMESRGADMGFLNATFMGAYMAADTAKWKRIAEAEKIKLD
jgi:tripartite-type tricarboxylate transporter receptor subunit TctC